MSEGLLTQQVVGARFSFYSDAEIRKLSVKQISNPQTFNKFGHATLGYVSVSCVTDSESITPALLPPPPHSSFSGLYDKALGPVDFDAICPTCDLKYENCP